MKESDQESVFQAKLQRAMWLRLEREAECLHEATLRGVRECLRRGQIEQPVLEYQLAIARRQVSRLAELVAASDFL